MSTGEEPARPKDERSDEQVQADEIGVEMADVYLETGLFEASEDDIFTLDYSVKSIAQIAFLRGLEKGDKDPFYFHRLKTRIDLEQRKVRRSRGQDYDF